MKSILCAIYGPICKLAKKNLGEKILNVTTVKLLLKKNSMFLGFFDAFLFQTSFKGQHSSISWLFTFYCLKMPSKIGNISKLTKELEILKN
jgi:hypothetical protein